MEKQLKDVHLDQERAWIETFLGPKEALWIDRETWRVGTTGRTWYLTPQTVVSTEKRKTKRRRRWKGLSSAKF